ncbi:alternative ribosome rescue aminoacyl-tRNA hydrolase ArfB [Schlesneria paludicola]|uniref:alternative ribosome rescue aminoacyl-tRNA hydrolase ArfB n=1 Tax=Schlesneria paludicola TaxID=360056 RepID=UPI00029A88DF|nr:alternative ribosome rescue aminoacyl-tRNA hydrolase ArfB [Schlesneria paludicola]
MFPADTEVMQVTRRVRIPCSEFSWSVARSSGPGGQNVNKVNSKAILRWSVVQSKELPADVRERFVTAFRSRMTNDGDIVISSERYRDQLKNVGDCLEKLRAMIESIAIPPKPRRAVKPTKASKVRRITAKRERGETKQRRKPPRADD